jgi:hypothetical protein
MASPSTWQEVSSRSLYIQNAISGSLNLTRCAIWVLELGKMCHPGTKGSKPAMDADVARSYIWGPTCQLVIFLFIFIFISRYCSYNPLNILKIVSFSYDLG